MRIRDKRGSSIALEELGGMGLAVIVLIGVLFVIAVVIGFLIANKEDPYTLNNYEMLIEKINEVMDEKNNIDELTFPYYIKGVVGKGSYILVGFNENSNAVEETCWDNDNLFKDKASCAVGEACLCLLYKNDEKMIDCFLDESISGFYVNSEAVFGAPYAGTKLGDTGKYSLVINGNCGARHWNTRNIKIEKRKVGLNEYEIIFSDPSKLNEAEKEEGCCCVDESFTKGCVPAECDASSCERIVDKYNNIYLSFQDRFCEDTLPGDYFEPCEDINIIDEEEHDECCCVNSATAPTRGCTPPICNRFHCIGWESYADPMILPLSYYIPQSCEDIELLIKEEDLQYCIDE